MPTAVPPIRDASTALILAVVTSPVSRGSVLRSDGEFWPSLVPNNDTEFVAAPWEYFFVFKKNPKTLNKQLSGE